jgi:hypothetical protein
MALPESLQSLVAEAQISLQQPDHDSLDANLLLQIGNAFGALSNFPPGINAIQRRHLLMVLLTIRHLEPTLAPYVQSPYPFGSTLVALAHGICDPSIPDWDELLGQIDDWVSPSLGEQHPLELGMLCLYTIGKAIESCLSATRVHDYAAETHSGVTLRCAADTYAASGGRETALRERRRWFWSYWLTQIVPRAWYALR